MARKSSLLPALAALGVGTLLFSTNGCGDSKASPGTGGTSGTGGGAPDAAAGGDGGDGTDPIEMPADVAGNYLVSLVNHENTCKAMADTWMDGATNDGVEFIITQKGVQIEAETMGGPALYFLLLTGANEFTGEIHDSHFVLTNYGPKPYTYLTCNYTINAVVEGDLDGDAIAGTVTYQPVISENPDCDDYDCAAVQVFSGTRPGG